jgi:uncharacterized protein YceK
MSVSSRSSNLRWLLLCLLAGCGTGAVRGQGTPPPYAGVRYDLSALSQVPHCAATAPWSTALGSFFFSTPALLVDTPLSLIADTLFLPWDARNESESWQPPPNQLC